MFRNKFFTWCSVLALTAVAGLANESSNTWIRGIYTGQSPRPVATATETEAWQQAGTLADHTPRTFVIAGSGRSMQPLYAPGTVLVLQELAYPELKRGQTVLYRTKQQKVVAHVLVAKARDGWRVQGLNNPDHDPEPVLAENLVGVVVGAFKPAAPDQQLRVASHL